MHPNSSLVGQRTPKWRSTACWRAAVIVDDRRIVRSHSVNDLSVGRSPAEVLRIVQALRSGGLCAADWKKGQGFVR